MEKTFTQICELFDQFSKDANLQMEKGNKAAGTRARKVSLELEKLLKHYAVPVVRRDRNSIQFRRVTRSIEIIFILVLTVGKWRTSRVPYRKSLFASQRRGFIDYDKVKHQLCEISISLLEKTTPLSYVCWLPRAYSRQFHLC